MEIKNHANSHYSKRFTHKTQRHATIFITTAKIARLRIANRAGSFVKLRIHFKVVCLKAFAISNRICHFSSFAYKFLQTFSMLFLVSSVDDQRVNEAKKRAFCRTNEVLFLMSHLFSFEADVCTAHDHYSNQMEKCSDMHFMLNRSESRGFVCVSVCISAVWHLFILFDSIQCIRKSITRFVVAHSMQCTRRSLLNVLFTVSLVHSDEQPQCTLGYGRVCELPRIELTETNFGFGFVHMTCVCDIDAISAVNLQRK